MTRQLTCFGWLVLCALAVLSHPMRAQETASPEQQAMMEKWASYATPGEAHARLAEAAGDWEWTSTFWMDPTTPPQTSSGTSRGEMMLGGRYLAEQVRGDMWGQTFEGRSLTGYDNHTKEYTSVWIDNMGTGVMVTRGKIDPATGDLVMTGTVDDFMDGKKKAVRTVTKHVDKDTTRFEMYMEGADGKEFKTMELVSKRKAATS